MTKFIQIHTLTGYSSALINRDDTGLAKRISFGGKMRTRISSQCQKRAWRMNAGQDAIRDLAGMADDFRTKLIIERLGEEIVAEGADKDLVAAITPDFVRAVYGSKAWSAPKKGSESGVENQLKSRQGLLFSWAEREFIKSKMIEALGATLETHPPVDAKDKLIPQERAAAEFKKDYKAIMKQMRDQCDIPGGLTAALFGRMVTSDIEANVDAAIHVAHAFTVRADRSESDFFSAVEELSGDGESGAGHIGETEIGSGLFYGYVVVDVDLLVKNLSGDRQLAADVVGRLIRLVASVSPGAKLGSTAPYAYASTVLVEAGNAQPRSLSDAYRDAVNPETHEAAEEAMAEHLANLDETYATGEQRAYLSIRNSAKLPGDRGNLDQVSEFASSMVCEA